MVTDTQGWLPIYELKDQCGICLRVVRERRMAACEYGLPAFPAASTCPRFTYDWSDDGTPR